MSVFEPSDETKFLLRNINDLKNARDKNAIFRQVNCDWRWSKTPAEKAELVVAFQRGTNRGVFENTDWIDATSANFPRWLEDIKGRYGFKRSDVSQDVWDAFVGTDGKRIIDSDMMHNQNPVRYYNIPG